MELLITVILTYLFIKFIEPIFEVLFEFFTHIISNKATKIQLDTNKNVKEFESLYPSEKELNPQIGFHMEDIDECDEDYDLVEDNNRSVVGFKFNK